MPEMTGTVTVKFAALLSTPSTRTITGPVVVEGTTAWIVVLLHCVGVAPTPLNRRLIVAGSYASPKFDPVIVTGVPTVPLTGCRFKIVGTLTTKFIALLAAPLTFTTSGPAVVTGTETWMEVSVQLVTGALTPLNVTVFVPCAAPK